MQLQRLEVLDEIRLLIVRETQAEERIVVIDDRRKVRGASIVKVRRMELEPQLRRSFPVEGGADQVRRAYADSVRGDTLGIRTRVVDGSMWSTWPVRVIGATRPD